MTVNLLNGKARSPRFPHTAGLQANHLTALDKIDRCFAQAPVNHSPTTRPFV